MLSTLPAVCTPPVNTQQPAPAAPEPREPSRAFARQLQEAQGPNERAATPPTGARHSTPASGSKARAEACEAPESTGASEQVAAPGEAPNEAAVGATALAGGDPAVLDPDAEGRSGQPTANEPGQQDLAALLAHLRGHSPTAAPLTEPIRRGPGYAAALDGAETEPRTGKAQRASANPGGPEAGAVGSDPLAIGLAQARGAADAAAGTQFKEQLAAAQSQAPAQDAAANTPQPSVLPEAGAFNTALAQVSGSGTAPARPADGSTATVPAQAQAQLPAQLGSADFAPQLGAQISTFVRDGVQHAQLHLNPAEMGPVTVQIQLDGQTAQVHLMADQAQTRQALEQAMPQLAGSLRESGLTLTGGGVFQQPRQAGGDASGQDGSASRQRRGVDRLDGLSGPSGAADAGSLGVAAPRRRGVVDLVA